MEHSPEHDADRTSAPYAPGQILGVWAAAAISISVLALILAGCGGGEDSGGGDDGGYTEDDIASALGFHREHHETIYEMAPGEDCVVLQVLTSPEEIEAAQSEAGNLPTALAVNDNGDAAVMFSGFGNFSQDECVAPAEADLNSLDR
jgi:hypothetical protein